MINESAEIAVAFSFFIFLRPDALVNLTNRWIDAEILLVIAQSPKPVPVAWAVTVPLKASDGTCKVAERLPPCAGLN